jgi:hypothetical protein
MDIDPNDFFGTTDPLTEELAYIGTPTVHTDPMSGVRVYPPGEDLSTLIDDPLTSVKDVRTPEQYKPFEAIVCDLLGVDADQLRLVQGQQAEYGMIAMFEQLQRDRGRFDTWRWVIASYRTGSRPRVAHAYNRNEADHRYAVEGLTLGISVGSLEPSEVPGDE